MGRGWQGSWGGDQEQSVMLHLFALGWMGEGIRREVKGRMLGRLQKSAKQLHASYCMLLGLEQAAAISMALSNL